MPMPTWRRLLAPALLASPGVWLLLDGARRYHSSSEVVFGGLVVGGAVLLGRRGVTSQVLGRGAAWALLGPCLLALTALGIDRVAPPPGLLAVGAAAAGALALARPMLQTAEAKAAFAPLAFRRWLLLASSAAVAYAMGVGTLAVDLVGRTWNDLPFFVPAIVLPLLAGSLLASAVGVARMRAWGILLGALTSVLALVAGATASHSEVLRMLFASAALPGTMMVGAILAARARTSAAPSRSGAHVRIASEPAPAVVAARLRVAADDAVGVDELDDHAPSLRRVAVRGR
jgi:hypothetical protein